MKRLAAALMAAGLVFAATSCKSRDVKSGVVTGHSHTPASDWIMPIVTCPYKGSCTTVFIPMHDPELWQVQVQEKPPCIEGECLEQWLNVSSEGQMLGHPVGSQWP